MHTENRFGSKPVKNRLKIGREVSSNFSPGRNKTWSGPRLTKEVGSWTRWTRQGGGPSIRQGGGALDQIGRWALDQIGRWGPQSDWEVGPWTGQECWTLLELSPRPINEGIQWTRQGQKALDQIGIVGLELDREAGSWTRQGGYFVNAPLLSLLPLHPKKNFFWILTRAHISIRTYPDGREVIILEPTLMGEK